ncbi:MAG: VOC family protein [Patescibacteria group bacterium]
MVNHLTHYMINVKNVHRSVKFYSEKLGFKIEYETSEWAELKTENGMELALKKQFKGDPVGSGGLGFVVNDCRKATDILKNRGVKILKDCELREKGSKYLTQFNDQDGDVIWMVEKSKK